MDSNSGKFSLKTNNVNEETRIHLNLKTTEI